VYPALLITKATGTLISTPTNSAPSLDPQTSAAFAAFAMIPRHLIPHVPWTPRRLPRLPRLPCSTCGIPPSQLQRTYSLLTAHLRYSSISTTTYLFYTYFLHLNYNVPILYLLLTCGIPPSQLQRTYSLPTASNSAPSLDPQTSAAFAAFAMIPRHLIPHRPWTPRRLPRLPHLP
jgi:hypothetical protein